MIWEFTTWNTVLRNNLGPGLASRSIFGAHSLGALNIQLCLDLVKVSHSHTTCPVDDLVEAHVHFNPFQRKMTKNRIKKEKKEPYQR